MSPGRALVLPATLARVVSIVLASFSPLKGKPHAPEPLNHVWQKHCRRAIILILALGASLLAQPDAGTRSVEGRVLNSSGQVVVGAVVQIKDLKTLQIRSFITQEAGVYHFAGLSTNSDYEVSASKEGVISRVKTLRSLNSRKKVVIDLFLN